MDWTKIRRQLPAAKKPRGAYANLDDLVRIRFKARDFSFQPRQPVHSILSGRYASRLRGRGLNFEELRRYLPGPEQVEHRPELGLRKGLAAGQGRHPLGHVFLIRADNVICPNDSDPGRDVEPCLVRGQADQDGHRLAIGCNGRTAHALRARSEDRHELARLNVDAIEAGFPIASKGDF